MLHGLPWTLPCTWGHLGAIRTVRRTAQWHYNAVLTLDIHIDIVTGHCSLKVRRSAHVLAVRCLRDALQDQRLIGDDDAGRGM